jgi:hypothetical protein
MPTVEKLGYYEHSEESEKLAREIVGDGKTPNKFFVSVSNQILAVVDPGEGNEYISKEGPDVECKRAMSPVVFDSFEKAKELADEVELDASGDVTSVMIEDRLTGVVYERTLEKHVKVVYDEYVEDNSNWL